MCASCGDAARDDGKLMGDGDLEHDGGESDRDDDDENTPVGDAIAGTYWLRAEIEASASQPILGELKAQIDSTVTTYSLASISKAGNDYAMVDWQCQVTTTQVCKTAACSASETSTTEGQTYKPAKRTLMIENSSWSTSRCAQSAGWDYDCTSDDSTKLPSDASDARINDAGGGKAGVDIFIKLNNDPNHQCTFQAVQLVDVVYSGTVQRPPQRKRRDHGLRLRAERDRQHELRRGREHHPSPLVSKPGKLRILPKSIPNGSDPAKWECPSLEEFERAFGG